VADLASRHLTGDLETLRNLLEYACEQLSTGHYLKGPPFVHPQELVRRIGDRLVSTMPYTLPGAFAFGAISSDETVWALNADDSIVRWDRAGAGWKAIPGSLRYLSCPTAEQVWGVNAEGQVFHWQSGSWQPVDGGLTTIAAAEDGTVVGTASDDTVWRRYPGTGWSQLPGRMRRIAIRSANEILAVTPDDELRWWNGSDWAALDGRAREVAVGGRPGDPLERWCANRDRELYVLSGDTWSKQGAYADRVSMAGGCRLVQASGKLTVHRR
jgi:hypothetical protein